MPNNVSSGFDKGYVDLSQAPGADNSWDDLFQNPENPATPPQAATGTNPPQSPQAVTEPFLKAGDSVYNTAEEAARGLEYKDQLVARYRNFLNEQGFDPNELKPKETPQAQTPQAQSPFKYLNNGKKYYEDLADAVKRHDEQAYEQITRTYQQEVINSTLAPYAPLLAETGRQRAVRRVASEIPDFEKFLYSQDFKKTVDAIPLYKEMLQIGETDPNASERLHEVYKAVYLTHQGLTRNQGAQAPVTQAPPVSTNPTVRPNPTMSQSTLTPPAPTPNTQNWSQPLSNRLKRDSNEARTSLIQEGDRKFDGRRFEDFGL